MGRGSRRKPARLAKKLVQIRKTLGLSQNELISHLGLTGDLLREEVSDFERGKREPSLRILLEYARAAGVWVDVLIDDGLDLPEKLPSVPKHEGVRRRATPRSKNKR